MLGVSIECKPLLIEGIAATGLEHSPRMPENVKRARHGGADSGAHAPGAFAAVITVIMTLPLSDHEKAQVVRRLIQAGGERPDPA